MLAWNHTVKWQCHYLENKDNEHNDILWKLNSIRILLQLQDRHL